LARKLLDEDAKVVGYDPEAGHNAKSEVPDLEVAASAYDAVDGAHCLVLCTDWDEFRSLDLGRIKGLMTHPVVVDGRNLFDPAEMRSLGFVYYGTGRASANGFG
jgi:UDPglucose 6-dehydrogenase